MIKFQISNKSLISALKVVKDMMKVNLKGNKYLHSVYFVNRNNNIMLYVTDLDKYVEIRLDASQITTDHQNTPIFGVRYTELLQLSKLSTKSAILEFVINDEDKALNIVTINSTYKLNTQSPDRYPTWNMMNFKRIQSFKVNANALSGCYKQIAPFISTNRGVISNNRVYFDFSKSESFMFGTDGKTLGCSKLYVTDEFRNMDISNYVMIDKLPLRFAVDKSVLDILTNKAIGNTNYKVSVDYDGCNMYIESENLTVYVNRIWTASLDWTLPVPSIFKRIITVTDLSMLKALIHMQFVNITEVKKVPNHRIRLEISSNYLQITAPDLVDNDWQAIAPAIPIEDNNYIDNYIIHLDAEQLDRILQNIHVENLNNQLTIRFGDNTKAVCFDLLSTDNTYYMLMPLIKVNPKTTGNHASIIGGDEAYQAHKDAGHIKINQVGE